MGCPGLDRWRDHHELHRHCRSRWGLLRLNLDILHDHWPDERNHVLRIGGGNQRRRRWTVELPFGTRHTVGDADRPSAGRRHFRERLDPGDVECTIVDRWLCDHQLCGVDQPEQRDLQCDG
jgi:hypothetical protein